MNRVGRNGTLEQAGIPKMFKSMMEILISVGMALSYPLADLPLEPLFFQKLVNCIDKINRFSNTPSGKEIT